MAHKHPVYDTDPHFSIDPITRKIINQSENKTKIIQYDHGSERFTFDIPRLIEGHDMSLCDKIEIHYINLASNSGTQNNDVYIVDDMQTVTDEADGDFVVFSWLISQNATQIIGSLNFLIRFLCLDGDTITYAWNTSINKDISIQEGMNNAESVVTEYTDVLEAWKAEVLADVSTSVTAAEAAATTATERAAEAYNFANDAAGFADSASESATQAKESATQAAQSASVAASAVEKEIEAVTVADIPLEVGFENGTISTSGTLSNSTTMVRSVDFIEVAGKEVEFYSTDNNVVVYVCEYDENKTFLRRKSVSSGLIGSPREEAYYIKLLLFSKNTETYPQSTLAEYLVWECKNPLSLEYLHEQTVINQKKGSYAFDNILIKSINHRGYSDIAPENTLPAYRLSKQKGFDFAECDVAVTSDGVFVLCHDETINRTARNADGSELSADIAVSDVTYDELLTYDFGIWKGEAYAGTKIPTFEEFIILCRNIGLYPYIELKMLPEVFPQEVANNLVGIVKKYGMEKAVTYISFTNANLAKIAVADKNARLGLLSKSLTEYAIQKFAQPLFTGVNEVFIDHDSGTLTDEIITLCQNYGLPLEIYCPNTAEHSSFSKTCFTGYTSDRIIAKDVVFEANIGEENTGVIA